MFAANLLPDNKSNELLDNKIRPRAKENATKCTLASLECSLVLGQLGGKQLERINLKRGLLAVTGVVGVTLAGVDKEERKVREKKTSVQCFSQYFLRLLMPSAAPPWPRLTRRRESIARGGIARVPNS